MKRTPGDRRRAVRAEHAARARARLEAGAVGERDLHTDERVAAAARDEEIRPPRGSAISSRPAARRGANAEQPLQRAASFSGSGLASSAPVIARDVPVRTRSRQPGPAHTQSSQRRHPVERGDRAELARVEVGRARARVLALPDDRRAGAFRALDLARERGRSSHWKITM